MHKYSLKRLARSRTLLPLLIAALMTLSSLGFLVKDSIIYNRLKANITPGIELDTHNFESDSKERFQRFKDSLRTDWERKGWADSENWEKPKRKTIFSFQISRLGPVNEEENTILISGKIKAYWSKSSVSSLRKNKTENDIFPKDILKDATLNFSNPVLRKRLCMGTNRDLAR